MGVWLVLGLALSGPASGGEGETGQAPPAGQMSHGILSDPGLDDPVVLEDVEIIARRGAARLPPVVELDAEQIDAIGAWSIGEVLNHLEDLYGGQGEALILINGRLVPLPSVFSGFPPDAAVRVEVLPPEAAGLYGGRAGQTVYNLVLEPRYASLDLNGGLTAPTQGGSHDLRTSAQRSSLEGQNANQLRLDLTYGSGLRVGDRDIRDADGAVQNPQVSLRPESLWADLNGMVTRTLKDWNAVASLTARAGESRAAVEVGDRLYRNESRNQNLNLSLGLSGPLLGWQAMANTSVDLGRNEEGAIVPARTSAGHWALISA